MVGILDYVSENEKKHSFALAESFSKEKSGGQKLDYPSPIAIKENGGWRYNYGNMFYCLLVKQYLNTTQFDDQPVQAIFSKTLSMKERPMYLVAQVPKRVLIVVA